jgi:hypothetical protein
MAANVESYLDRLTLAHKYKPKFRATVEAVLKPIVEAQQLLNDLPTYFDLDTAIGAQLDVVGQWANVSRHISLPVPDPWFRFGEDRRGFGRGMWMQPFDSGAFVKSLDDETFRRLIHARIATMQWDGTLHEALRILRTFFGDYVATDLPDPGGPIMWGGARMDWGVPDVDVVAWNAATVSWAGEYLEWGIETAAAIKWINVVASYSIPQTAVVVSDTQEMQVFYALAGKIPDAVALEIFRGDYMPLEAAGVDTTKLVTSVDGAPLFAFGVESRVLAGFGSGAFGVSPEVLINMRG